MFSDLLKEFISPITAVFLTISLGCIVGRIKVLGFSLGLSGVLLISLIAGVLFEIFPDHFGSNEQFVDLLKLFSNIGTALFVSSLGIMSGRTFSGWKKSYFKSILIGSLVVAADYLILVLIKTIYKGFDNGLLLGTFCGSLTSTPGLASALERSDGAMAGLGYGASYPFGVLFVVFFVQYMAERKTQHEDKPVIEQRKKSDPLYLFTVISFSVIIGYLIGNIEFPGLNISLGNTGGILLSSIFIGAITKNKISIADESNLSVLKNLGLVFFFSGSGIISGLHLSGNVTVLLFVYGAIFSIFPVVFGYLISILVTKDKNKSLQLVCGIMTSTPAIGAFLERQSSDDLSSYSLSYIGALVSIIFFMKL